MKTSVKCNLCGKELDFWDLQEDFTIDKPYLGYGSEHDGDALELHLCCACLDKLVSSCVIYPVRER